MATVRSQEQARAGRGILAGTCLLLVVITASATTPAAAHPFGEPQTARISAEGHQVVLRWVSPPDDLIVMGGVVGALPSQRTYVFDVAPGGEPEPVGESDAELLMSSPALADYLSDHLEVRQDGQVCEPDVELDGLIEDGALVRFECARPVTAVDITITVLTDVHEAYRTAAVGIGTTEPGRALYTVDEPVHRWSFQASTSINPAPVILAGALAAIIAMLVLWFWRQRRSAPAEANV